MKINLKEFLKGIISENPTFVLMLGLCPTLAISTTLANAIGMSFAATFVLLGSNIIISLIKRLIPSKIRIPSYIVVIATFVTITELIIKAYSPALDKSLGIYIPLIVVNCIVLGRAEAFASKSNLIDSILDALGMGVGFSLALILISGIREFFGVGKIFGNTVIRGFEPVFLFAMPSGALLIIGILMGFFNFLKNKK